MKDMVYASAKPDVLKLLYEVSERGRSADVYFK